MDDQTRDPGVAPPPGDRNPSGRSVEGFRLEHATLQRATEHGGRLFNDGAYHESHGCFENVWSSVNESYRQGSGFEQPTSSL